MLSWISSPSTPHNTLSKSLAAFPQQFTENNDVAELGPQICNVGKKSLEKKSGKKSHRFFCKKKSHRKIIILKRKDQYFDFFKICKID